MEDILIGFTDFSDFIFIPDPASTDGSGKTGLVAANLTVSYSRMETDNDATVTDVTSSLSDLAALTTAHTDWGLKEVSSSLAPGLYRLDIADAVFASGAWKSVVYVMVTTSAAAAVPKSYRLVARNDLASVQPVNVVEINSATGGIAAFERATRCIAVGTVGSASTTTSVVSSACTPAGAVTDQFKGRIMIFDKDTTTTALRGQATDITASNNSATPTFTVTALTTAPVSGDTFTIQ